MGKWSCAVAAAMCWRALAGGEPVVPSHEVALKLDTGWVVSREDADEAVASWVVGEAGAPWLRLTFGPSALPRGAHVRLTGLADGAEQTLDAAGLERWSGTSAYFNGGAVLVEIVAGSAPARVTVESIAVGEAPGAAYDDRSICGPTDDRALSNNPAIARFMPMGCTAWIVNDANKSMLTAGHCYAGPAGVVQFNVPPSTASGALVHPPPSDQYPVDWASVQYEDAGVGRDWCYFGCPPNTQTGLTPYQAQGAFLPLGEAPVAGGQGVRVTGYGTVTAPVPLVWNQVQKTHAGRLTWAWDTAISYVEADTTGGNSGSPVIDEVTGRVVGIHTHAGCYATGGANRGTCVNAEGLRAALAAPLGVCRPAQPAAGALFATGAAGAVGVVGVPGGAFGVLANVPAGVQCLAYDWNADVIWMVTPDRSLLRVDAGSGWTEAVGPVAGLPAAPTGLGFDPATRTLFAVCESDGLLVAFDPEERVARPIGIVGSGVHALEYEPVAGVLFALRSRVGGSMLLRLDPASGAGVEVGTIGAGGEDCRGLAATADGFLYSLGEASGSLLRIDPSTAQALCVGACSRPGVGAGMTSRYPRPPCLPPDFSGDGIADQDDLAALLQVIASGQASDLDPDLNRDGVADAGDVETLVDLLAGAC